MRDHRITTLVWKWITLSAEKQTYLVAEVLLLTWEYRKCPANQICNSMPVARASCLLVHSNSVIPMHHQRSCFCGATIALVPKQIVTCASLMVPISTKWTLWEHYIYNKQRNSMMVAEWLSACFHDGISTQQEFVCFHLTSTPIGLQCVETCSQ